MYKLCKQSIYCSNDFLDCNLFFLSKLIDSCFMRVRTLIQFEIYNASLSLRLRKHNDLPQAKFHCKFLALLSYPFHASHSEISKLTKTWYIKPQILEAKIVITGILTELLFPLRHLYKNTVYFAATLLVPMGRASQFTCVSRNNPFAKHIYFGKRRLHPIKLCFMSFCDCLSIH